MRNTYEIELSELSKSYTQHSPALNPSFKIRNMKEDDFLTVGKLDYISIQETVEFEGESEEQLIAEMQSTFLGKYGALIKEASFVILNDDEVVAAIVVVCGDLPCPLIANLMTHPSFQRKGLASQLIEESINALIEQEYERAFFAIHPQNHPSLSLASGFQSEEGHNLIDA